MKDNPLPLLITYPLHAPTLPSYPRLGVCTMGKDNCTHSKASFSVLGAEIQSTCLFLHFFCFVLKKSCHWAISTKIFPKAYMCMTHFMFICKSFPYVEIKKHSETAAWLLHLGFDVRSPWITQRIQVDRKGGKIMTGTSQCWNL